MPNIIIKGNRAEQRRREFIQRMTRERNDALKRREIDYSDISDKEPQIYRKPRVEPIKVVDRNGNDIRLNGYLKTSIYNEAKWLRQEIRDGICTKTQCWKPDKYNVEKMLRREFPLKPKIDRYKKLMRALNPDEKDIDIERLRRGR